MSGFTFPSFPKDGLNVAAGVATVIGGVIAVVTLFGGLIGGDDSESVSPTAVPGEFLRVRFGTVQDPATRLPGGPTVGPDGDVQACPSETLFAWVEHSFKTGTVLDGSISNRDGIIFRATVEADEQASNFWISGLVSVPGIHTLSLTPTGLGETQNWRVNVTC